MSDARRPGDDVRGQQVAEDRWRPIGLVAKREIVTRLRSKVFRITTAIAAALILAGTIIPRFVDTGSSTEATIGIVSDHAEALEAQLLPIGETLDVDLSAVTPSSAWAGAQQVRDGDLDVLLVERRDGSFGAISDDEPDPAIESVLSSAVARVALDAELTDLGADPQQLDAALAGAAISFRVIDDDYDVQRIAVGTVAGLLIYLAQLMYGQTVAQGVVEEKQSRIVELLLATIRPSQLLAGKVLGIGAVGLLQMLVLGVVGLASGLATGVLDISLSSLGGILGWVIVWFVLGFLVYSLAFAACGALVSRQEDIGAVVTPITMVVVIAFVVGISVLPTDPGSGLVRTMSLIPVFSPILMPMRLAIGGVPWWEALAAVALVLAMAPALVWLGGRIYRNAVLRTGSRVSLRDALGTSSS